MKKYTLLFLVAFSLCYSQTEPKAKVGHIYASPNDDPFDPHTYYALVMDMKQNDEGNWFVKYIWTDAEDKSKNRYIGESSDPEKLFLTAYEHRGKATALDSIAFKLIR